MNVQFRSRPVVSTVFKVCLAFLPVAAVHAECCSGVGGLSAARFAGPKLGGWSEFVGGGAPKIAVTNPAPAGQPDIWVKVTHGVWEDSTPMNGTPRSEMIRVRPGETAFGAGMADAGAPPGAPLTMDLTNETGGAPAAGSKAEISWDMGPKKPNKSKSKTEETVGSSKCETCKTNTSLPTSSSPGGNQTKTECDAPSSLSDLSFQVRAMVITNKYIYF